jgi:hypothetical protein
MTNEARTIARRLLMAAIDGPFGWFDRDQCSNFHGRQLMSAN